LSAGAVEASVGNSADSVLPDAGQQAIADFLRIVSVTLEFILQRRIF
jgi:hypothetical protein